MHELSVANSIIEIVQRSVPGPSRGEVRTVNIRLGTQAGVVPDSLLFYFDILKEDAGFKNAHLVMENIPFIVHCVTCDKSLPSDSGLLICPECGGSDTQVVSGTELLVADIELEDPLEPHHH